MSDHDFMRELGQQWKQETSVPELTIDGALASQRKQARKTMFYLVVSLVTLVVAGYFLTLQLTPVTAGASIVLILSVLVEWFYTYRFRRPISQWGDWSPEGLLRYHEALLTAELRNSYYLNFSALALLAFTAFLWIVAGLDATFSELKFHRLFSGISIPVCLAVFIYSAVTRRKVQARQIAVKRIIDEFAL